MTSPPLPKTALSLKKRPRKTISQIFRVPLILFGAGLFGLILALLETGWVDVVAGLAISTSLGAIIWGRFLKSSNR